MKRHRVLWILSFVIAFLLANLGAIKSEAAEGKVFKWKMQSFMPSASTTHKYLQEFCLNVNKATGGRLQISLFPAGALFPDMEGLKNVGAGVAEISYNYCQFYQGVIKEAVTLMPPFGLMTFEDHYNLWYYGGWREVMEPYYKKYNIYVPAKIGNGAEPIWSKVPIKSMQDFKGLKMRMSGAAGAFFHQKLGVSVTLLPGPELYTALKLGTIDACEYSGGILDWDLGMHEVTKYMIMPYYLGNVLCDFLVNRKAYESLPEDIRKAFDMCCSWAETYVTYSIERDNRIAKKRMVDEKGMQVIWLPDSDVAKMRELARQFWDEQLATVSPDSAKLINLYKNKAREVNIIK